ncbi:helix-turn-helix domain-containing protein [Streptococcus orisasini]
MFPDRLKSLRLEANLTQKQIAEKLNITQQAYQAWESGKRKPGEDTLKMFADFFDISTDYLVGRSNLKHEIPEGEELEKELDRAIDNSVGFEGEPVSDYDREVIKEVLRNYFKNQKNS